MMNTNRQEASPLVELFQAWQESKDREALEQLVHLYLPLVHRSAQRLKMGLPNSVEKEDLISWGHMGLLDALKKFEYARGWTFETYAVPRIRGAMLDGLRKDDWVPRSQRDKAKKVEEAYRKLEQTLLRVPKQEEICEFMGITDGELRKITTNASLSHFSSLDEPIQQDDEPQTLMSRVVDESAKNEEHVIQMEEKRFLSQMIDELSEKEKLVLTMIYYEELTFSETAEVLRLTTGRISQIHSKAMSRLQTKFRQIYPHY